MRYLHTASPRKAASDR